MKYFRLYNVLFIAMSDKSMWVADASNSNDGPVKGFTMADIGKNPQFEEAIKAEGVEIKDRIFEMNIPKRMNAQEHLNVAMYLSNLDNKERRI